MLLSFACAFPPPTFRNHVKKLMSVGVKNDLRAAVELNHLAVVKLILVISVLSSDFCYFSSRKSRKQVFCFLK